MIILTKEFLACPHQLNHVNVATNKLIEKKRHILAPLAFLSITRNALMTRVTVLAVNLLTGNATLAYPLI